MHIARVLGAGRVVRGAALFGALALLSGCGDEKQTTMGTVGADAEAKARTDAEQKAREAAYGKGGVQGKGAAPKAAEEKAK
jgi:hypothetical protein